ncbi:hypothetical protein [uncultured Oscillibacter sp.]|uniref:hypothetical protein n=1 Tax=uncultured Oscillibacter sp. TaxID=876091 RepID=UPI0025EA9888|nr:hypothetical protein [uncultured Oscillibacter sp.]
MPRKTKKNAQGAGTIRKRSDGRWEARYTTGFAPVTGRQTQRSIYGKTQKEVRERLAEITTELDDGTYIEPSQMTLEEWMAIWLEDYMFDKNYKIIMLFPVSLMKAKKATKPHGYWILWPSALCYG